MAFGLYGFGGGTGGFSPREPAPRRLTLEELLELQRQQQYQPTPRPEPIGSISELDPDARRRARLDSVWTALAAMGSGLSTGNWQNAARGVGDIRAIQEGALDEANARAEQEWARENQELAAQAQAEQQRQKTAALYGMYEKVVEGEPDGPFAQRAEAAAKAGSMSELSELYGQKPKRSAIRAKGLDPDSWDANDRIQAELQAELAKQKAAAELEAKVTERKALDPLDVELAGKKETAQQNARLPVERELKAIWVAAEKEIARYRAGLASGGAGGAGGGGASGKSSVPVLAPWPGGGKILIDREATLQAGQPVGVVIPGAVQLKWVQGNLNDGVPTRIFNADTMELVGEVDMETGKVTSRLPKTKVPSPLAPGAAPPAPSPASSVPPKVIEARMAAVAKSIGGFPNAAVRDQVRRDVEAGHTPQYILEQIRKARGDR